MYCGLNIVPSLIMTASSMLLLAVPIWYVSRKVFPAHIRAARILLFAVAFLLNPLSNVWILEPINNAELMKMREVAERYVLKGMTISDVEMLFGRPTSMLGHGDDSTWRYKPVPLYVFGANFEVHFQGGKVASWEWADH